MHETLIGCEQLAGQLGRPGWVVIDCRFSLDDQERGRRAWREGHIPGARYAHLDEDLASEPVPGQTGWHPLPDRVEMALRCAAWGIGPRTQVVVYDDAGGGMAARCWWLLRWLGHRAVAVLDGGWQRWLASGGETRREEPRIESAEFTIGEPLVRSVTVERLHDDQGRLVAPLFDARDGARFRGEVEPFYAVAGHIPGARSLPFAENLAADGCFLPVEQLRARFTAALGGIAASDAICYCGSGVTAAHNVLAMQHAGLGTPLLYVGSWSEWIAAGSRPVATGEG